MTPEEARAMQARAKEMIVEINAMHTQENLDRLRAEAARGGGKLTGTLRRKSGFTLRGADGNAISGITLRDVESIFAKRQPKPRA